MEILLHNTRANIKEINNYCLDPLDVFRIINLPTARDWTFRIEFDEHNRNHLHIESSPPLTEKELLDALDGRIPSLYGFDALCTKVDDLCFRLNLVHTDEGEIDRETNYVFDHEPMGIICGQLKVIGFPSLPILQKGGFFRAWVYNNTWFGSEKYVRKGYLCNILAMGNPYAVETLKELPECPGPVFRKHFLIELLGRTLGDLGITCRASKPRNYIRHWKYGRFSLDLVDSEFWKKLNLNKYGGLNLEIIEPSLHWYTSFGPNDFRKLKEIINGIINLREKIEKSDEYLGFIESSEEFKKQHSATALSDRQDKLVKSQKVLIDGIELMAVPTCENEVVALYMKIEGLRKLPFDCKVLEYTKKNGIDALAVFQIKSTECVSRYAPVEFEHKLENFFEHEHPLGQTNLIICWDKEEGNDIFEFNGELYVTLEKEFDWLYYLKSAIRVIPVLILSRIPKLKIR